MIPKSVSGSTRIIALGAVLAWPVWGWAGDGKFCVYNGVGKCSEFPTRPGDTWIFLPGVYDTKHPFTLAPKDVQCYQRMREAMKLAAKHHFWPMFEMGESYTITPSFPPTCDDVCQAQRTLDAATKRKQERDTQTQAQKQWDQTMKDCVEGRE